MNNEIKEILDKLKDGIGKFEEYDNNALLESDECEILLDYITNLDEKNKELKKKITFNEKSRRKMQQSLMEQIEDYKSKIEKADEYGNNCLELLKDQENYICESIDIVELLKMIHKNYIDILNGRSDE